MSGLVRIYLDEAKDHKIQKKQSPLKYLIEVGQIPYQLHSYIIPVCNQLPIDWQWTNNVQVFNSIYSQLCSLPESSTEETGHKQSWEPGQIPEHIHHKV